jgi:cytochrome P450
MEASLRELMRLTSIFTLGIAHRATEDTHLSGYFIPKASVYAILKLSISSHYYKLKVKFVRF